LKNNLRACIKKGELSKGSFVRKVPGEIDILNDYRQKFELKRNYATPVAERPGLMMPFEEQFYNKARKKEVKRNSLG